MWNPFQKAKEKAMQGLVFKGLRYVVAFAGGSVATTSDDTLMQAAGYIVALGSLAVSVYKDHRDARAKQSARP